MDVREVYARDTGREALAGEFGLVRPLPELQPSYNWRRCSRWRLFSRMVGDGGWRC